MRSRVPTSRRNPSRHHSGKGQQNSAQSESDSAQAGGGSQSGVGEQVQCSSLSSAFRKPRPKIPVPGPFAFEVFALVYSSISLILQHLNLYKTVWWLPTSYNNYALNYHLIDPYLILFVTVVMARRVIWTVVKKLLAASTSPNWTPSFVIVGRSLTTLLFLSSLFPIAYRVIQSQSHHGVKMWYMSYPAFLYFCMFGWAGTPLVELEPQAYSGKLKIYVDREGMFQSTGLSSTTIMSDQCQQQISVNPEIVRQEVMLLRNDFNFRLRQVLFNSLITVYYGAIIPVLFAPRSLYYETAWVIRHSILVWVGALVVYASYLFPTTYSLMMHKAAVLLGHWSKVGGRVSSGFHSAWSSTSVWSTGSLVKHNKEMYRASSGVACAEPGDQSHHRFYVLFREPSTLLGLMLMVQSGLVLAQHLSLTWSTYWYQLLSEGMMLFLNYFALYNLVKDYIVCYRLYAVDSREDRSQTTTSL